MGIYLFVAHLNADTTDEVITFCTKLFNRAGLLNLLKTESTRYNNHHFGQNDLHQHLIVLYITVAIETVVNIPTSQ